MIPIIAVIGRSKSGKTALVEYLISSLSKEGLKVGTVKHVHNKDFSINTEGKNTWRHSKAGAEVVVSVAPREIAVIKKIKNSKPKLEGIVYLLKNEELDLLILEGLHSLIAKRKDIFKIVTAKSKGDLLKTLEGTLFPILAITGPVAQRKTDVPEVGIPVVDLYTEGEDILKLVRNRVLGDESRIF